MHKEIYIIFNNFNKFWNMKKFLILILTALVTVVAHAQIFTHKMILNKFDDIVSERDIKTLIEKNDTTFIIEEKGNEPVTYKVLFEFDSKGSKDNIVQLVGNVYGYQEAWGVILEKDFKDYVLDNGALSNEEDDSKRNDLRSKLIEKYYYLIIHRVVTDQFGTQFLSEHYCIKKASMNINYEKIIYSKIY